MRGPGLGLALALVLLAAACATVDPLDDLRIESEVKARLVGTQDENLTRLGVLSRQATVYLSGTVESDEARVRAERVAAGVRGVQAVVNGLEVGRAPR
jgi:hyperosmotically inducible protein